MRIALNNLPKGSNILNCTYDKALERIDGQMEGYRNIANQVLAWIVHARRPLSVLELQHALAVFPGDTTLDKEGLPNASTLTDHCAGLVSIEEETRTVRLVHHTAQEFFERILPIRYPQAHTNIAATCLTYLSFDIFAHGECNTDEIENRLHENPFLAYAAEYWDDHVRRGSEDQIQELILNFFNQQSNLSCSVQVDSYKACSRYPEGISIRYFLTRLESFLELPRSGKHHRYHLKGKTRLHIATSFGLTSIVRLLMKEGTNVSAIDCSGMTALHIAATEGFVDIVKLLLEVEASYTNSEKFLTPLDFAMARGQEGVVRVLLERGHAKPDKIFDKGGWEERTLLTWAAEKGYTELVRLMLLDSDVRGDSKDGWSRTALSYAAEMGHGDIVRLLLTRDDVDATAASRDGRTPLSFAAKSGHEEVVRLLLKMDNVKPDSDRFSDLEYCRTALSLAAEKGHEGIVRQLLLRQDVNVDLFAGGHTPLFWAAERGHEGVVQQLIQGGAKVDATDSDWSGTALGQCAADGNSEGVKMLIKYGADIEARDRQGLTAMDSALHWGHVSVVQLLLENGAQLNVGSDGSTALHQIVFNENDEWIRDRKSRLNERTRESIKRIQGGSRLNVTWHYEEGLGCNPEPRRRVQISLEDGRTEWTWTPPGGHKEMIDLLLKEGVEMEAKDIDGRTALLVAVIEGHEVVVRLLLERGADINAIDGYGQTALHWAASEMNPAMLEILLENGADITAICDGRSAMHFAAANGQEATLRMLLAKGAGKIDADSGDKYGCTPLYLAAQNGHEVIVKLLLNTDEVEPDLKTEGGWTPLLIAAENGHEAVVKLLLNTDGVNPNLKTEDGWTTSKN